MGIRSRAVAILCAAALGLATTTLPASAAGELGLIADQLPMPLSVDNGRNGKIYVAGGGQLVEIGRSGERTVLETFNGELTGVSVWGRDVYYIQTNEGGSHLVKRSPDGRKRIVSNDFLAYEATRNPDRNVTYGIVGLTDECEAELNEEFPPAPPGQPGLMLGEYKGIVHSHAYQTSVYGGTAFVADAGANAILKVNLRTKRISTVAVLPPARVTIDDQVLNTFSLVTGRSLPSCVKGHDWLTEAVPTDVKLWLNGSLYVSALNGSLGELLPIGAVHRINLWNGKTTRVASGFLGATGLDVSHYGDIYVAEMFGSQVTVVRRGSSKPDFILQANMAADVEVDGRYLLVTKNVFENGTLIRHRLF